METHEEFNEVFRAYYKPLYFFARQYVDDVDECHDIVESAFEDILLHFASIEQATARQYLYINVRNKCIDWLRHLNTRKQYAAQVMMMGDIYYDPHRTMEIKERERIIDQVLNTLEPPTKDIFIACYVDRKRYKEVAKLMNITEVVVKNHIMKALKMIRSLNLKI